MPLTVAQLVARLTADTSNFYRGMALANSAMLRSGGLITRVAAGAGLATLGMGIMSLRAAGNYEQSMNILEAVSGAGTKQMKALGDEAIALGRDFKLPNVSARDAADAMTELAKGGLSVKQVMGATKGTLQLGIAANIGYADSANIVARALVAFHLEGRQATKVADLFTAAANKSTAEMSDIALGFQMASAQFKAGDQTIEGLTTSLTLMANAGIVGSDAGTSLKTMMNRLMAPTKKAKDLMGELGISVYDSAGNMRPMPALISQLNQGMQGMSKEQKNAALYTLFGSDAIRAARVQMNAGRDGWLKMEKAITKGGEAQKFAEARTKGFNGAMQAFGSAMETLAIELGTKMLPAATKVVRAMASWVAGLDADKIAGFFGAIRDGVKWIYDLIHGSVVLQAILGGLIAGFVAYRVVVVTITAVTKAYAAVQAILNAVMEANPIVLLITILAALAVGLYIAYQRSETFRNIVQAAFKAVQAAAQWVWDALKVVGNAFQQMWNLVQPIVRVFQALVTTAWNVIRSLTQAVWPVIAAIIRAAWTLISTVTRANLGIISAIISGVWGVIKAVTTTYWNIIKTIITSVLDVIHGKISAMQALKNIVGAIWAGIKVIIQAQLALIKGVVQAAIDGIWAILRAAAATAGGLALSIGKAIVSGILGGIGDLASSIGSKIGGGIKSGIGWAWHHIGSTGEEVMYGHGKSLSQGIIMGWVAGSVDLPQKITDTLKNALEAGKRQIDNAKSIFSAAMSRLGDYSMRAFDAATAAHKTPTEKILGNLISQHDADEAKRRLDEATTAQSDAQKELDAVNVKEYDSAEEKAKAVAAAEKSLNDAIHQVKEEEYQIRIAAMQKIADAEVLNYQSQRDLGKQHLQDRLQDLENALMQHPEKHKFYQDKIIALLNSYGIQYKASGGLLGKGFAQGLRESEHEILAAARAIAKKVADILKLHSPAKEGPLSDLNTWWTGFASTLLQGLNPGVIQDALTGALAVPGSSLGTMSGAAYGAQSARATGGTTVNINNPTFLTGDRRAARDLAALVEPHLAQASVG